MPQQGLDPDVPGDAPKLSFSVSKVVLARLKEQAERRRVRQSAICREAIEEKVTKMEREERCDDRPRD